MWDDTKKIRGANKYVEKPSTQQINKYISGVSLLYVFRFNFLKENVDEFLIPPQIGSVSHKGAPTSLPTRFSSLDNNLIGSG